MKKYILALLIWLLTCAVYGQHKLNYVQKVANDAIISFPDTPRISTGVKNIVYQVAANDMIYTVSSYGVSEGSFDFLYRNFANLLYQRSIAAFIKTIHGRLIYQRAITQDGIKGVEFECNGTVDSADYYLFYRIFYYNKKLISQGLWFKQPVSRFDDRLSAFFSTFKFTGKASHNSPWNDKAVVIKGIKYAFVIILIITLVIGAMILIVKRPQKKSFKNE